MIARKEIFKSAPIKTWNPRFGRRKPYFLIGAILCSLALLAFPFSSSLWMAAGLS